MSSHGPTPLITSDAAKDQTNSEGVTPGGVQSVDRAITVLEVLARTGGSTVTEVAAELKVHKSTASRLLSALELRGLVHHPSEGSRYQLGFGILRLAHTIPGRLSVVAEAREEIRDLARTHSETVNLAVLQEGLAVNVDQEMGPSSLSTYDWIGSLTPLHATSSGKVLLAGLPSEERAHIIQAHGLPALTGRTITSRKQLERQLIEVAARGYATVCEEFEIGLNSVAVPVRDHLGTVIASISVSGPAFRFTEETMAGLVEDLKEAGLRVSRRMGYVPSTTFSLSFNPADLTDRSICPLSGPPTGAVEVSLRASSGNAKPVDRRRATGQQGCRVAGDRSGWGDVDTHTPMGSMVFTVMAALAQMELEIKRERITDSVAKRRAAGKDLGGCLYGFGQAAMATGDGV